MKCEAGGTSSHKFEGYDANPNVTTVGSLRTRLGASEDDGGFCSLGNWCVPAVQRNRSIDHCSNIVLSGVVFTLFLL